MNWKAWITVPCMAAACVAAYLMNWVVWWDGYQGRYEWLLACNVLRFPVMFVSIAGADYFRSQLEEPNESSVAAGRRPGFGVISLILLGCLCFVGRLIVPVIAALVVVFLVRLLLGWKTVAERKLQPLAYGFVCCCAAFLFTAYQCSALSHQALLGFRQRIEERVDPDDLRTWASTIPAHGHASASEMPPFLVELMGNIPGWPIAIPANYGADDPCVLVANGSGYGLGVEIHLKKQETEKGWLDGRVVWKPGIYLTTVSK